MNYQIKSFQVDHDFIVPGMYLSRVDGDVLTFDLRTRKPNCDNYMDNVTMHSVEHMFATYARFSEVGNKVVYFGPMGCRTGFYFIVRDSISHGEALELVKGTMDFILGFDGEIPGSKKEECGNYLAHSLPEAKAIAEDMKEVLSDWSADKMTYPA